MSPGNDRAERLAAKLRENLRRRKAQARAAAGPGAGPEAGAAGDSDAPDATQGLPNSSGES
ncbi:hypothetical protein C0V72_01785 [Porphyrobacter sp. TH134]|nr:hypothetical protein C0V72_01785 [Porphyrobacter sp. TH134]